MRIVPNPITEMIMKFHPMATSHMSGKFHAGLHIVQMSLTVRLGPIILVLIL